MSKYQIICNKIQDIDYTILYWFYISNYFEINSYKYTFFANK